MNSARTRKDSSAPSVPGGATAGYSSSDEHQSSAPDEHNGGREWFRSSDDVRTGFIRGTTFGPKPVRYSVLDGRAVFEGDIVLGRPGDLAAEPPGVAADKFSARGIAHGIGITGEEFRWPQGRFVFEIDPGVPAGTRTIIQNAMAHWEQNTNIRFTQRTPANSSQFPNFVRFIAADGCWSHVGMRGGMQEISIAGGCGFGAAVHEIGHAVGLWHEQSREDRDQFVRVRWENVEPGREHNFDQHIADGDDIGGYDFGSIMHYGRLAFSRNGQPTIEPVGGQQIGQRDGLSQGDIQAVRALYPNLEPAPQTTRLFRYWNAGSGDHFYTTSWAELGRGQHGWTFEIVQCYIYPMPAPGTQALFRYYNAQIVDHFYTTNFGELGSGSGGWVLEGVQGYVYATQQPGTVPLHRYWNPGIGDHFYTTNFAELGQGAHGWAYEGIQCYVHQLPPVPADTADASGEYPEPSAPRTFSRIGEARERHEFASPSGGGLSFAQKGGQPSAGQPSSRGPQSSEQGSNPRRTVTLTIDLDRT